LLYIERCFIGKKRSLKHIEFSIKVIEYSIVGYRIFDKIHRIFDIKVSNFRWNSSNFGVNRLNEGLFLKNSTTNRHEPTRTIESWRSISSCGLFGSWLNTSGIGSYSFMDPSSVSLNWAESVNFSSMTLCVPPVSLGLVFSITILPSFFPLTSSLARLK